MRDYRSYPIRIPASSKFIKGFTGKVNKMYFGSFIVLFLMMGAFAGSFFSAKLIYLVPIIGTAYWGCLFLFAATTLLIVPKKDRSGAGFKFYAFAMLALLIINGLALWGGMLDQSNFLLQRVSAATSLASLLIPVWIWNTSRKIKIASSLEGESGKVN